MLAGPWPDTRLCLSPPVEEQRTVKGTVQEERIGREFKFAVANGASCDGGGLAGGDGDGETEEGNVGREVEQDCCCCSSNSSSSSSSTSAHALLRQAAARSDRKSVV